MKGKWKRVLSFLLAITILFTSEIIPQLSVKVQAENGISKTEGSNYPYYCETCGFYYTEKNAHRERVACTTCNHTGKTLCTLCKATGRLYCGQEGTYTETITQGQEIASGMMDSATHIPIGTKVPTYHNWKCNICKITGTWTYWTYYNVPGIVGDDDGIHPTNTSAHNDSSMPCTQCNGTGQYGGQCSSCNGLGSREDSSFCTSKWKYCITFDENGGNCDTKSGYYAGGCALPSASKEGYRFLGWNTDPSSSTGNGSVFITAPTTYYAIFEKLGTAEFIDMEGNRNVTANSLLNKIYAPSIRAGDYSGIGWTEQTEPDSSIVESFQSGKTYYARYQTYATIEYHMGKDEKGKDYAGSSEKPQGDYEHIIVNANAYNMEKWQSSSSYLMPKEPKWQGHTFFGWFDGNQIYASEELVQLQKPVTVFTALWKLKSNQVLLDSTGATNHGDTFVEAIAEEIMPDIIPPKREYTIRFHKNAEDSNIIMDHTLLKNTYLFHGYYTSDNGNGIKYYNEDGTSTKQWDKTEDITLYAFWTNEGIVLPTAGRKGYLFQGWSISSNATEGIKAGTNYKAEEDIDFYAIWKKETYSIQYHLANGILSTANPVSYDIDTESFTLNNPTRVGYTFLGWTGDNGTIPEKNIQIVKGTVGNKNYTANWSAKADTSYEIVIHRETLNRDYLDSSTDIVIKKKGISDTVINAEDIAKEYQYEGFSYSYAEIQDSITGNKKGLQMNIDGDGTAKLHLYYQRNQYQLTIGDYDKNQLTTSNTTTTLLYGEKIKLKASLLSGYKFSHWDSGNTEIQPDLKTANATMIMAASDISMTPVAEEITYTVEFKANDTNSHTPENNVRATQVPNAQEYDYKEEFSMPVCIRDGFRFLGWSTSKNGSELWSAGTKVSQLSTVDKAVVKLYAQWEENQYSIQFHANDGAATAHNPSKNVQAMGSMDLTKSYYYTDNIVLPSSGFTRTGFTFLGWSLAKDSNVAEYKSGDFVHNLSSINNSIITVYAAWSEKSYPIIFKPGDSYCYGTEKGISEKVLNSQVMDTVRVYYTDGFTMPECGYVREGFTFLGWSKNKKASEITYTDTSYQGELQPGDRIPNLDMIEEHIYYPVWKECQYKIIYHSNDNKDLSKTEKIVSKNIYYTENFCVAKGGFSRIGFTFRGWSTERESMTVSYAKEEMVLKLTVNEVIDFYAVWKENSYRISFQPNDDYCYGKKDGIAIKVSNPNAMSSLELKYTEEAFFPECAYIREGFTFLGWSENKRDSLKTYEEDITVIKPGTSIHSLSAFNDDEVVYYPIWKEHQYSIHFDKNDENNAKEPANEPRAAGVTADIENIYYTQEVTLTRNQFTRTGFDYKGWSDTKGSNSYKYHDRESIRKLSNQDGSIIVLYAAWLEHSYTIHFKPADNYCYNLENNVKVSNPDSMQSIVLKYTENWNVITNYKRTGFSFLGYSGSDDNQQIYKKSKVPFSANETINRLSTKNHDEFILYTIWKENTYQVCFHSNDIHNAKNPNKETKAEGITIETENRYYTEKFDLPKNHFKRKGFTFLGWSNKERDNTVIWEDSEECQKLSSIDKDIVNFYAAWSEHQYTISFNPNDDYCYGTEDHIEAKVSNPNDMKDSKVYYTEDHILPECNYIRKGFHFKGWTYNKDDSKKLYLNDSVDEVFMQPGDNINCITTETIIMIYAVWQEDSYGICFHGNSSTADGTMEPMEKIYYSQRLTLPENQYIREGFIYQGWSIQENSDEIVYKDKEVLCKEIFQNGDIIDLYAIWKEQFYDIVFNPNDTYSYGSTEKVMNPASMSGIKIGHTTKVTLPENKYQRKGFIFKGWTLNKNDVKKLYPNHKEYDKNYQAPYQAGDIVSELEKEDGDIITFYPVWEEISYCISFHANDKENAHTIINEPKAEGSMENIKVYYTEEIVLPKNKFTRTGFVFKGWSKEEKKNLKSYKEEEKLNRITEENGSTITLYAAWSELCYTITYNANDTYSYGNSEKVDDASIMEEYTTNLYYTDNYKIPDCHYIRKGFTFQGWTLNQDDVKKLYPEYKEYHKNFHAIYQPEDMVSCIGTKSEELITLYPLWKEHKITISFDKNAKDAIWNEDGARKNIYYTEDWKIENIPKRVGYQWKGYSQDSKAEKADYLEWKDIRKLIEKTQEEEIKTLYAIWDTNKLTIIYESDGMAANAQTALYGQSYTIADEIMVGFDRPEKTFLGWSIEKVNGYGTEADIDYKAGMESNQCFHLVNEKEKEELHLYAIWRENVYQVIFDMNGGTGQTLEKNNIRYTEEIVLPQNQSIKEGYTFQGWSYEAAGEVDFLANEVVSKLPKYNQDGITVILYAIWFLTPPEVIEQTKEMTLGKEIKPNIPVTISVSAIGLDIHYQWYYMDKIHTSGIAIENAIDKTYTIPAEEIIEENDGRTYYCILKNESGEIKSEPITLSIYGTPNIPVVLDSGVNSYGWSSRDIQIIPSGSTIKGSKKQVGYLYSFDRVTWLEYKELIWKENTLPDGKILYFCAYNKECTQLKSPIVTYTVKKDDENPKILDISKIFPEITMRNAMITESAIAEMEESILRNNIQGLEQEIYPITIYAKDDFSGIISYAVVTTEKPRETDWQEYNTFEVSAGTYYAYVMDRTGNITKQEFTVYAGGYILLSESSGSYTNENVSYVVGEGIANWDNTMNIDKSKITHIIIQDGITEIPNGFFEGFINLKEVTIPDSVINIGENAFYHVPDNMVIHASKGSKAAEAAEELHYTKYTIQLEGIQEEIQEHYYDKIKLPETAPEKEGYLFIGWGTKPEEKEFEPGEIIYGLSPKLDGIVVLYPIYKEYKKEKEEVEEKNPFINDSFVANSNKVPNDIEITDKDKEQKEDQKHDYEEEIDSRKEQEINKEQNHGYYKINEKQYDSLEDIFDQDQEIDGNGKKIIYANGENIISDDLRIPENVVILVNGTLIIQGDLTLLGEFLIEKNSEVMIEGNIIAEENSKIYLDGKLRIHGGLTTNGDFHISETGILDISIDGNCEILSKGIFENNGTILGTVNNYSEKTGITIVKTKFSSIVIKENKQCKIKPLKGITKWKIKNKKIVSIKKKKGYLILTGKKKGKTILIGKTKECTYQYLIVVKKINNNQVGLITTQKEKSKQWILTKKGIFIRKISINSIEGNIRLKLLKGGKNVKWRLLGKEILKGKGCVINAVIDADTKYILKVKYKGKQYRYTIYRES